MSLTQEQVNALLRPLNAGRVAKRTQAGMQLSYLEAWDVRAHLIRIFGFGTWDFQVLSATLAFEDAVPAKSGSGTNWSVGYLVRGMLAIHDTGATYSEAAVGMASLPQRGEAHDMAVKTGASDALKRCAINLGDQMGLSLYAGGSLRPVVGGSIAHGFVPEQEAHDADPA